MLPVVTAEEMRGVDEETITKLGIPGAVLMENAGRALVAKVQEVLPSPSSGLIVVVCGGGNNGGDGYVAARVLGELGHEVALYAAAPQAALGGDARLHADAFLACGGVAHPLVTSQELEAAAAVLAKSDLVIDALFGTGLDRPLGGHWKAIVELMNAQAAMIVAVDIPSGLGSDDGSVFGAAVSASATVCFAATKVGVASAPGFAQCGRVSIAEIGIPQSLTKRVASIGLLEREDIQPGVEDVGANSHKGTRGHVLAIAGSPGKQGAGRLVGMAALRAGAGLVTLAAAELDTAAEDPLMTALVASATDLAPVLVGKSAVVVGPGMDTSQAGHKLVIRLLSDCTSPLVIDADGLNHLGGSLALVASAKAPVILTPHPGEAARLLGVSSAEIQEDRIAAVRALAEKSRALVVLKGARSCICDGRGEDSFVAINPTGGPELGTAGTGDVLAGTIGAILARGVDPTIAVWTAVYWHGAAGTLAAERLGGPGLVATDLIDALPQARGRLASA